MKLAERISRRDRRLRHSPAGGVAQHLGQQVPPEDARRHCRGSRHRRDLPSSRQHDRRCRDHRRGSGALGRTLSVGAASGRDSGRPHRLECGSAGSQARDVDHQLHGVGHRPRFHGTTSWTRSTRPALRSRRAAASDTSFHPAAEGRIRQRCRGVHVGAAVVHGHLRPDVLHGFVGRGRRGAQMATFDVGHPDVLDFIRAKREDGRLRQSTSRCSSTANSCRRSGTTPSGSSRFR